MIMCSAYIHRIAALDACPAALAWLRAAGHPTLAAAWAACPRADWLLWLAARCAAPGSPEHRAVVAAAADCAAEVKDCARGSRAWDEGRHAIDTARRWARGEATVEECKSAAKPAVWPPAAAYAVGAACASNANVAATAAALAIVAGADPSALAAIVRRHIPTPPTLPE